VALKEEHNPSTAKKFSGIMKIKDPRIIEEIAERDLPEYSPHSSRDQGNRSPERSDGKAH